MRASSPLIYFGTQAAPERQAAARVRAVRAVQVRPARLFQLAREAHNCVVQGSTGGWNSRYAERPAVVTLARLTAGAVGAPFTCSRLSCTFFRCTKKKKKKKSTFHKKLRTAGGDSLAFYWDFELGLLPGALWSTGMQVPPDRGADSCRCRSGTQQEVLPGGGPEGPGPSPCRLLSRANLL